MKQFKEPTENQMMQELRKVNSKLGTAEAPYTLSDKYYKMGKKLNLD